MKIAIYETVHIELVIPLARLLKDSPHSITFWVHEKMKADIESSLHPTELSVHTWIYLPNLRINALYTLLNGQCKIQHFDLLWLNTIDSRHMVFAVLRFTYKKTRMLINIHEINNFFRPALQANIKQLIRAVSKKVLSVAADGYLLSTGKMKENIEVNKLTRKPCYVMMPVYHHQYGNTQPEKNKFTVVVAGTVDERRRDYRAVLDAWKIFLQEKVGTGDAVLLLAGEMNSYGTTIQEICTADPILQNTVCLFNREIPETRFRQLLDTASVLLSPQQFKTSTSDNILEEYGHTKNSGNTFDAIRHAKPYIIPHWLPIPTDIETSAVRYTENSELADILKMLYYDAAALHKLSLLALENARQFSYETVRRQILDILKIVSALL
ncbi:MAG: hypothetical protein ABI813_14090 [Bacteroidota bacterium]